MDNKPVAATLLNHTGAIINDITEQLDTNQSPFNSEEQRSHLQHEMRRIFETTRIGILKQLEMYPSEVTELLGRISILASNLSNTSNIFHFENIYDEDFMQQAIHSLNLHAQYINVQGNISNFKAKLITSLGFLGFAVDAALSQDNKFLDLEEFVYLLNNDYFNYSTLTINYIPNPRSRVEVAKDLSFVKQIIIEGLKSISENCEEDIFIRFDEDNLGIQIAYKYKQGDIRYGERLSKYFGSLIPRDVNFVFAKLDDPNAIQFIQEYNLLFWSDFEVNYAILLNFTSLPPKQQKHNLNQNPY